MFKRMSVVFCGLAVTLMTAGYASAQTATEKTKTAVKKAGNATEQAAKDAGANITDAAITTAVKTKLLGDTKVGGLKIDVDTNDHVVTLTGPVHSAAERAEAIRLAKNTTGVKRVVSKLVVETTAGTTGKVDKDDKLKVEIKDDTKETKDKVKEKAGQAKDATKDAARKTAEVTTDAAITSAVKTKLLADTQVGGLKIDVDTKDNVVTLTGTVKSAAEKAEAIRLAKTTKGVSRVVDKLTIQ
jgi:osmotically-inducible protein OsmY